MGFGGQSGSSSSISGASDVTLNAPASTQVLTYDSNVAKWKNAAIPASASVADGAVTTAKLASKAVTADKLADDIVEVIAEQYRTLRNSAREPLNLRDYGAVGNGVADDTDAVSAWLAAITAGGTLEPREGYAPAGTYKIMRPLDYTVINRVIRGGGQRTTIFKAGAAMARVFDFRQTLGSLFEDFAIDGNNLADICIDLSWLPGAASSRIGVTRVRTLNALDCGYFVDNLGDSIFDDCNAGPFPDSACVMHWSNQGGNSYIKNPTWFPWNGVGAVVGPTRASLEASFQNLKIEGGGMMGLECIDGEASQTLSINGVQMYPYKNNANISGPRTSGALQMLTIEGASKVATHTPSQSYFGGRFGTSIVLDNVMLNSGASGGTPNAFGGNFVPGAGGTNTTLMVRGSKITAEQGMTPVIWNDNYAGLNRSYDGFQIGTVKRNIRDIVDVGGAEEGHGLSIGGGEHIRTFRSVAAVLDFPPVSPGSATAVGTSLVGAEPGNLVEVRAGGVLPIGCQLYAEVTATDTVRVTLINNSASAQDIASGPYRLYLIGV